MLTLDDEAREYLFVLLDHIRDHIPEDECFRLSRDATDHPLLYLSRESVEDEAFAHQGQTVLVWDPEQFTDARDYRLEVDEGDLEEELLLLTQAKETGLKNEAVVEIDGNLQRLLAEKS